MIKIDNNIYYANFMMIYELNHIIVLIMARIRQNSDMRPLVTFFRCSTKVDIDYSKIDVFTNDFADEGEKLFRLHGTCYTAEENVIRLFNTYFENVQQYEHLWLNNLDKNYNEFKQFIDDYQFIIQCPMCLYKLKQKLIKQSKTKKNIKFLFGTNNDYYDKIKIYIYDVAKLIPNKNEILDIKTVIINKWMCKKYDMCECIICSTLCKNINGRYTCNKCNHTLCNSCHLSFDKTAYTHEDLTCDEAKIINIHHISELETISESTKCPSCHFLVQRTEGCNHMQCSKCNTHFCYSCGDYWNCGTHASMNKVCWNNLQSRNTEKEILSNSINKCRHRLALIAEENTKLILNDWTNIRIVKNKTEELNKLAIYQDYRALELIDDQSYQLCIYALRCNPKSLQYIRNKTDAIYKFMFENHIMSSAELTNIGNIDQNEHICEMAIRYDYTNLQHVKNQTDKLCKIAIGINDRALQYVVNQTDELCKLAIRIDYRALQYVKNQTDELCKLAIDNNFSAISYVKNQTDELCKLAIDNNFSAISYVKHQTNEMCELAIGINYMALQYVAIQTDELCKLAIDNNFRAITYVKNPSKELREYALRRGVKSENENHDFIRYICNF